MHQVWYTIQYMTVRLTKYQFLAVGVGLILCLFLYVLKTKAIPVPFISQAPYGNWLQPWQDACEEASIVMIDAYYQGVTLDKPVAKTELLELFAQKERLYGRSLDENAEKIVGLIHNFFSWDAEVVEDPSLEMIKRELDDGHPVIAPVYGKALKNPYFKNGGPDYHVIVMSDYDEERQEFITNEPGTQHGESYRYSYTTIMDALHDYLPRNRTKFGKKVIIITRPSNPN